MKRLSKILILVLSTVAIVRCGTTTGNYAIQLAFQGTTPGSLGFIRSTPVSLSVINRDGSVNGTLQITDARVALKEIKIKRDQNGLTDSQKQEDDSIRLSGPFVVDLLAGSVTPAISSLDLPSGNYESIELKLDKIEGDEKDGSGAQLVGATDALFGKSIYLEGTFSGTTASGAASNLPFTLSYDIDEELKLDGTNTFALTQGTSATVIVAFRMAKWFLFSNTAVNDQGIDFRDIVPSGGRIDLGPTSSGNNQKNWQVIKDALEKSMDFGEDGNGDGKLGKDEDQNDDDGSDN